MIAWNIATGYEAYGPDYERYDEIVMGLVRDRKWEFLKPVKVSTYRVIKKTGISKNMAITTLKSIRKGKIGVFWKIELKCYRIGPKHFKIGVKMA